MVLGEDEAAASSLAVLGVLHSTSDGKCHGFVFMWAVSSRWVFLDFSFWTGLNCSNIVLLTVNQTTFLSLVCFSRLVLFTCLPSKLMVI